VTALIYIDPETIQPVIDGEWHRARLNVIPEPGQQITMLCGKTGAAAFEPVAHRRDHGAPKTCFECEAAFMREQGMPVPPNHPSRALRPAKRKAGRS
jgi:hypothetical protein